MSTSSDAAFAAANLGLAVEGAPPAAACADVLADALGFPFTSSQEHLRVGRRALEQLSTPHAYGLLGAPGRALAAQAVGAWRTCLDFEDAATARRAREVCGPIFSRSTVGYEDFNTKAYSLLEPALGAPQLVAAAKHVLGTTTYLEWGGGGSTERIAPLALRSYTIEHVTEWCQCMKSRPLNTCLSRRMAETSPSLANLPEGGRVHCVNTRMALRGFGRPTENATAGQLKAGLLAYVNEIDVLGERTFDTVFVDGRMRVACALKALKYLHEKSVVMIHDWTDARSYAHPLLLHHYDVIALVAYSDNEELCPQRTTDGEQVWREYATFPASPRVEASHRRQDFCRLAILRPRPGHAGMAEPFYTYLAAIEKNSIWKQAWS